MIQHLSSRKYLIATMYEKQVNNVDRGISLREMSFLILID